MGRMGYGVLCWISVCAAIAASCDRTGGSEKEQGTIAPPLAETSKAAILRAIHEANQASVRASLLAGERALAPEVKRYAAMLVHDDTDLDNRLLSLAKSEGVDLDPLADAVPVAWSRAADRIERSLSVATGKEFDAAYLTPQVLTQEYVAGLCEQAGKLAAGREMSTLLGDAARQTSEHLVEARRLSAALSYQGGMGGGPAERADSDTKKDGGSGSIERAHLAPGAVHEKDAQ